MIQNSLRLSVTFSALSFCCLGIAETTQLPPLKRGDTWTYRQSFAAPAKQAEIYNFQVAVVVENKDGSLVAGRAGVESPTVWSLIGPFSAGTCVRDMMPGESLELDGICNTALTAGKKWEWNRSDSVSSVQKRFVVAGIEEVKVPFGSYLATRIEVVEINTDVAYPGIKPPLGGYQKHFHTTYWYAREVKGFVKIVREKRQQDGTLVHKMTEVLTRFRSE